MDKNTDKLEQLFAELFAGNSLLKIIFSGKRKKSLAYSKVMMRPLKISGKTKYQAEYTYPKKVTHSNLEKDDARSLALRLVCEDFKQLNIFTRDSEIQVLAAKPETPRIMRKALPAPAAPAPASPAAGTAELTPVAPPPASPAAGTAELTPAAPTSKASTAGAGAPARDDAGAASVSGSVKADAAVPVHTVAAHNRAKNYVLPAGVPCDFLIRLGIMSEDGTVFPRSYGKFRQINRYLEIVEDVFPYLPKDKTLKIIDFGCGKAYLTFALYHYLKVMKQRNVEIIGLDLKEDVIDFCSGVASDLGYDELKFLKGDIADYTDDHADMVVTLHACDTATDYALIHAVDWNTKVILSVPCCQHELFKQIKNDLHKPILKHGILKDRFTEYLTDGLRGLKLEACGYNVAMIEFTSLEHTARNIMIKAVKTNAAGAYAKKKREAAEQQYQALCDFYQVTPTIGRLGG